MPCFPFALNPYKPTLTIPSSISLVVIVRTALKAPMVEEEGLKTTFTVSLCPGAILKGVEGGLLKLNEFAFVPIKLKREIFKGPSPILEITMEPGALILSFTLLKIASFVDVISGLPLTVRLMQ
ncbi:MAG: hypothetical protein WKG06_38700 [Segetibacter sp.]